MAVSNQEIEFFADNGYFILNNVFNKHEIAKLKNIINYSKIPSIFEPQDCITSTEYFELTTKDEYFVKLVMDERLLTVVEILLNNKAQLSHSKLTNKPVGVGKGNVPWHQDAAFLQYNKHNALTIMIYLDDINLKNGGLNVIKKSHKLGLQEHINDKNVGLICHNQDQWTQSVDLVALRPKAGDITIHHCLMLHSSADNLSEESRCTLTCMYRDSTLQQSNDALWHDYSIKTPKDNFCTTA